MTSKWQWRNYAGIGLSLDEYGAIQEKMEWDEEDEDGRS